jgi:octaprenyl-diphosphate synthase
MRQFGELTGLAFQIKDDIFDYGMPGSIGKPTGLDIRERKMTLPLIYVLNNSPKNVKNELINIVKNKNENPSQVARATALVIEYGGIEYAYQKMKEIQIKALDLLTEIPDSQAKKSMIGLLEYTIERQK